MKESASLYIDSNKLDERYLENGKPFSGIKINESGVIRRFRQGLLDWDAEGAEGVRVVLPAVEWDGHIEYWRGGRLHRDNGLAAVISGSFHHKEFWEDGGYVRTETEE